MFEWYNEATDAWLTIEVDVEVCDDGGDDIFEYLIDNGYSAGPYVVRLFNGWGEKWQAQAYANNGTPATLQRKRHDGPTGQWTATRQSGYVVKYFRAHKVAP
jgi:hypothetical protein